MPGQRRERRHSTLTARVVAGAPTELIVGLAAGVSDAEGTQLLAAAGAQSGRKLRRVAAKVARVDPARLDAVLRRLRSDPRVRFAEPNYKLHALATPNDSAFGELWGLVNSGQAVKGVTGTPDADIDAEQAWNVTTGSSSVVVGILDTGVDFSHPDLGGSQTTSQVMWRNPGETGAGRESNGVDDDGNGYVDDWRGWDWANDDNNPQDDMNHGTHVAGTLGALGNNGQGIAGVNWNVKIMALKLLDSHGDGDLADAVEALRYATAMGARITNSSWGGGGFSQAMFDELKAADAAGALFVAAAGNSGADNDAAPVYPASYDVPNVIAVAGTDQDDGLASFSNRGAHERRRRGARDTGLLHGPRRRLRLGHRHLDVGSARDRHGRARSSCVSRCDGRRTEGAAPANRRSEGLPHRRHDDRGAAQCGSRAHVRRDRRRRGSSPRGLDSASR